MVTLSSAQAAFAQRRRVAHLATAAPDGRPHVMPVCFVLVEGRFYSAIDEKPKRTTRLRRLRNIELNPRVSLVFDRYDEDWQELGWVLVEGTASIVVGGAEHERALAALRQKYPQYESMRPEGRPLIRVTPEKVSSWGQLEAPG